MERAKCIGQAEDVKDLAVTIQDSNRKPLLATTSRAMAGALVKKTLLAQTRFEGFWVSTMAPWAQAREEEGTLYY